MKRILFFLFLIFYFPLYSQQKLQEKDVIQVHYFALRLMPSYAGFGQFFIVYRPKNRILDGYSINWNEFLREASGNGKSEANLKRVDYFERYGLSEQQAYNTILNLWRLRYAEYPYARRPLGDNPTDSLVVPKGWAANCCSPSEDQMKILSTYGIQNINDLIVGENLFRLLRDMNDKIWVENYKNAK